MKTDSFQSCGHSWVVLICWHIECSTFTASSFRIWNSSTGIPSPPLALFVVMLSKAHLSSHSRMSGYRWVITPSWLSESWRSFLYSSSVYSCHPFLISSASVLYRTHLCMKCSLGISNFLEEISSLSHSVVFLYFFALITEEVFLISPCYSLELCVLGPSYFYIALSSLFLHILASCQINPQIMFLLYNLYSSSFPIYIRTNNSPGWGLSLQLMCLRNLFLHVFFGYISTLAGNKQNENGY